MYDMCEILIDILLSAAGALMWCVLITFCCMCAEHLLFKKRLRPRLTDKEIILIREVLAGHISLPQVANSGLFAGCVDRIEHIFERFITKSRQQMEQLEEIGKTLESKRFEDTLINEISMEPLPAGADIAFKDGEPASGLSYREMSGNIRSRLDKVEKEILLQAPIYAAGLPKPCRRILQKKMECNNVKDLLHLMLRVGNRKSLLKIYGIGEIYADKLETFMFGNGLIYLEGYAYKSRYEEPEKQEKPS
ncbi:hypothetical protein KL86DYS2_20104 [uncultured Dysgonomonas sp.]|uniref:Uncharacterized protein n=1 Tax=uncultured Dysgonomonas sp. TaxID=206096 RepID=A0A212KFQ8_9BACT|nr:hypothetical protein KL86DYS2_20104 [uncultured Dysgonomonas sp.]